MARFGSTIGKTRALAVIGLWLEILAPHRFAQSTLSRVEREGLSPVLQLNHEHEQLGLAHILKRVRR